MFKEILKNIISKKNDFKFQKNLQISEDTIKIEDLQKKIDLVFGRSLKIREVDAGSCNACEWECTALTNPFYDIQRFGIDFVASPRHADALLVTGPVSRQMELALKKTYLAVPEPKLVIGCGDCAIDGGIYKGSYAVVGGVMKVIPVDCCIRGCPPSPAKIIEGITELVEKLIAASKK